MNFESDVKTLAGLASAKATLTRREHGICVVFERSFQGKIAWSSHEFLYADLDKYESDISVRRNALRLMWTMMKPTIEEIDLRT